MDFDSLEIIENGVLLKKTKNFNPKHIFECGQCFRWNREDNGNYIGVAHGKVIEIEERGKDIAILNSSEEEFNNIWRNYFHLDRDYNEIKKELSKDSLLKNAVEFGKGIRILKQEPFEIIVSFIISANNRIPMIKRAIERISEAFGEEIQYKGKKYYTFPKVSELYNKDVSQFEQLGTGFRAKYIKDTVDRIHENSGLLDEIISLNDNECHNKLQEFSGIGPKVSDCIMLFSMNKYSAFPVDVWVKRAMMHFYLAPDVSLKKIRDWSREKFGDLSGFAQQYLFYYARENNIKIE